MSLNTQNDLNLTQQLAFDVSGINALRLKMRTDPAMANRVVAQQFEGLFLNMMMKSMRQASLATDPLDSSQTQLFRNLLDQQTTQNMARGKGLGLADLIAKQLDQLSGINAQPVAKILQQTLPVRKIQASAPIDPPISRKIEISPLSVQAPLNPTPTRSLPEKLQNLIEGLREPIQKAAELLGVSPRLVAAHTFLESGWGKHEIRGQNGQNSHNLFGIKAGANWHGDTVEAVTTEYSGGVPQKRVEKFRAYGSYAEAFQDYVRLLSKPRYQQAVNQGKDALAFATGLQRGGYATDPSYADKIIRMAGSKLLNAIFGQ